jgi:type IV pilus assembly protein PilV
MALIEVLVSILIFSFGVLGLIGLEASAVNFSVDAEDRNRASLFASDIASSMWLNGTVDVTSPQLATLYTTWQTNIHDNTQPTGLPNGTLLITPAPATVPNGADILITWAPVTDKTGTPARQLTTRVILP